MFSRIVKFSEDLALSEEQKSKMFAETIGYFKEFRSHKMFFSKMRGVISIEDLNKDSESGSFTAGNYYTETNTVSIDYRVFKDTNFFLEGDTINSHNALDEEIFHAIDIYNGFSSNRKFIEPFARELSEDNQFREIVEQATRLYFAYNLADDETKHHKKQSINEYIPSYTRAAQIEVTEMSSFKSVVKSIPHGLDFDRQVEHLVMQKLAKEYLVDIRRAEMMLTGVKEHNKRILSGTSQEHEKINGFLEENRGLSVEDIMQKAYPETYNLYKGYEKENLSFTKNLSFADGIT